MRASHSVDRGALVPGKFVGLASQRTRTVCNDYQLRELAVAGTRMAFGLVGPTELELP